MNQILFTEEEIQTRVKSLAIEISLKDNLEQEPITVIGVLNGAFMFFTDLVRNLEVDCQIDFIQAKSYTEHSQDTVRILKDINLDITGKDIYVIDDIFDSGNTIRSLITHFESKGARKITPVTLFKRHTSYMEGLIYGFELQQEFFLVGYGLDGKGGFKRNQPFITGEILED